MPWWCAIVVGYFWPSKGIRWLSGTNVARIEICARRCVYSYGFGQRLMARKRSMAGLHNSVNLCVCMSGTQNTLVPAFRQLLSFQYSWPVLSCPPDLSTIPSIWAVPEQLTHSEPRGLEVEIGSRGAKQSGALELGAMHLSSPA